MKTRHVKIPIILGVVLTWELLFYRGVINSSRFSHPLGLIDALRNLAFLFAFGETLLSVVIVSLLGVTTGLALAGLISQSSWLSQTAIRFLHFGLWAPFFVFWAVPYWLLPTAVAGVSLFACYHLLGVRLALPVPWREAIWRVQERATLHALLFYLLFELWFSHGWRSMSIQKVDNAYAILVLLQVFVFFLDRLVFRFNFPTVAEARGRVLVKEISGKNRGSLWGVAFLIIVCLIAWQLLTDQIWRHFRVGSPLAVLETLYPVLASGEVLSWMVVSLLEVFGGLLLGGGVAVLLSQNMAARASLRNRMFTFLPLTFIVPLMFRLVEVHWVGWNAGAWRTALDVGLLTFYPFVLVLWGLRNDPLVYRTLLAAEDALPYAFLAMLYGETVASSKGLGFYIVWTRNTLETNRSLGAALLTFALLVFLSFLLRSVVRRWHPNESTELQRVP